MTINIISDIHCCKDLPPNLNLNNLEKTDVLVIAGDVATFDKRDKIIKTINNKWGNGNKFDHLIYCWGNHDYYSSHPKFLTPDRMANNLPRNSDNKETCIGDIVFLSSTLWTNIKTNAEIITASINDYNYIEGFSVTYNNILWESNVNWLRSRLEYHKSLNHKVVIVSHHLPSKQLIAPDFRRSDINGAYCSLDDDDEQILRSIKPDLWIHGHSHQFMDKTIDGVRFIRNPFGYDYPRIQEWPYTNFKLNTIVEI